MSGKAGMKNKSLKEYPNTEMLFPISQHLRKRRAQLGVTQEEVAKAAGIGIVTYRSLESGRVMPTIDKLLRACTSLNLELILKPKENSDD